MPWLRPVILALAGLLIVAYSSTEVSDPDTWWHLKTGQFIVQHRALPVPDPFAFTTYMGQPAYPTEPTTRYFNLTHEWLAQILLYLAYAGGGYTGLILLRSAFLAGFCGIVGLAAHRRTGSFYRALFAALAAASVVCDFRADRPQLITYLFLATTLAILEYRRWLWLLPPMFVIWANCHGGFFMGWIVLGAYAGESLFFRLRGKPQPGEARLWMVSLLSILASGINPNVFRFIPVMLSYRSSIMQSTLWEWQYPLPFEWPPRPFSILLFGGLAVLIWQRRRTRPADWLLLLVFGAAALTAVRNVVLVALVGPLMIATYLPWKWRTPRAVGVLLASLLVASGYLVAEGRAFQFRAAEWHYAGGAADFLLAHHITGPMFNTYELGGYLIWRLWPRERVFIDGRALNESVYLDYQRIAFNAEAVNGKSGEELLKQYGIEVIVMDGFEYTSGAPYLLPAALSDPRQTEWKLVYRDEEAVVYMKHPPPGVEPLNSFDALASMETQCRVNVENDPGHSRCTLGLAQLFARIGDGARARKWQAIAAKYGN